MLFNVQIKSNKTKTFSLASSGREGGKKATRVHLTIISSPRRHKEKQDWIGTKNKEKKGNQQKCM